MKKAMTYGTVINCMDGRVQLPVLKYLQERFKVEYVDSITEPGPCLILSEGSSHSLTQSILDRLKISIEKHGSKAIAIVAHHDCAGNPVPYQRQIVQLQRAIKFIKSEFRELEVIGLWVDEHWVVHEIS